MNTILKIFLYSILTVSSVYILTAVAIAFGHLFKIIEL